MTVTISFLSRQNENPMTDANLTQSNSGACSVDANGYLQVTNPSTANLLTYSGTANQTQSVKIKWKGSLSLGDWNIAACDFRMVLLYADANNYVKLNVIHNGTDDNWWVVDKVVGGSQTGVGTIATGVADTAYATDDEFEFLVTWAGANATFELKRNGTRIGSTVTGNSFPLTSGKPGYWMTSAGSGRNNMTSLLQFTGDSGDTTAPVLTSPVGSATASTTATVGATTDEGNGTLYAVVTGSATQPSVAQIKAGNDHTGSAAVWSGNVAVSSTGAKTLNATGLTGGSSYYVHLVHTDAAANDSNRVTSSQWTQLVKKVKLKLALAAAGETVDGIVWANQAGGIAGAEIGEFTGQTIGTGSGADAGLAVLKVPVSVFGGGSLSVGDTVQVYVRKLDLSKDSDVFPATVIEE